MLGLQDKTPDTNSPLLPPAVAGVPETLRERIVVYFQLRDLRVCANEKSVI